MGMVKIQTGYIHCAKHWGGSNLREGLAVGNDSPYTSGIIVLIK